MKQTGKPADAPAARPTGAFEVVGTSAGKEPDHRQAERTTKAAGKKPTERRPTFIEPLERRTIIG